MNLDFNLNLTQEQKLIMTQEMQLSVKLLQMSAFELSQYIEKELQENPVLEANFQQPEEKAELKNRIDYKEFLKYLDFDNYEHHSREKAEDEEFNPINLVSAQKSLKEYLIEQIDLIKMSSQLRYICEYIVGSIDDKGYLEISTGDIAGELNVPAGKAEEALSIVQSLEPDGIGARDLKECLKIQLNKKGCKDENLFIIIDNYLQLIADNKYNELGKLLNIDIKSAQQYGDFIRSLEPKPSRGYFTGEETGYIIPDAYITKIDGENYILMNDNILPRLSINNLYKEIIRDDKDKTASDFVKEKLNNAVFLIKSIEHRKSTIYRVIEKILEIQKDFFDKEGSSLRPMTMKEIADSLEVHESTVSRAIRDKYIGTSRGTIKLKDLFTTGISQGSDEDVSSLAIKKRIGEIISGEDKSKPLSDQAIAEILVKEDMNISRRTVAKYREQLNIKSSGKRKRY